MINLVVFFNGFNNNKKMILLKKNKMNLKTKVTQINNYKKY